MLWPLIWTILTRRFRWGVTTYVLCRIRIIFPQLSSILFYVLPVFQIKFQTEVPSPCVPYILVGRKTRDHSLTPVIFRMALLQERIPGARRKLRMICVHSITFQPGRVAQSVGHLTRKSGVLGSIPGLATYFRFSFRFFKKGSCQLLAKVCARSTG